VIGKYNHCSLVWSQLLQAAPEPGMVPIALGEEGYIVRQMK
jgi:hypothetical protein